MKLTTGFVAGTLVHAREGLRPIEQIRVGDHVLSSQGKGDGEPAYKRVISTREREAQPHVPLHVHRFRPNNTPVWGLLENPNQEYADDDPPGNAPNSWYLSKVYNLEVEEFHAFFVDTMGIWCTA